MNKLIFIKNNYYNNTKFYIVNLIDFNSKFIGLYKLNDALIKSKYFFSDLMFLSIFNLSILSCKLVNLDKIKYLDKKYIFKKKKKIKKQKTKEMSFNLFIGSNDYKNKIKFVNKFFKKKCKVRVILKYKGRERSRKNIINNFIFNLIKDLNDNGFLSVKPKFFYKSVFLNFDSKWN